MSGHLSERFLEDAGKDLSGGLNFIAVTCKGARIVIGSGQ